MGPKNSLVILRGHHDDAWAYINSQFRGGVSVIDLAQVNAYSAVVLASASLEDGLDTILIVSGDVTPLNTWLVKIHQAGINVEEHMV